MFADTPISHTCAKDCACAVEDRPTPPPAPPSEMVTIFPFDWQNAMSDASAAQLGSAVPANVALSVGLHICVDGRQRRAPARVHKLTFARFNEGRPPVLKNVVMKATWRRDECDTAR
jgi:hypothetical protein